MLHAEADKTLAGVAAFLSDPRRPIEATLQVMMATDHFGAAGPHPVIASAARELLNRSDNERSGVFSTAMSFRRQLIHGVRAGLPHLAEKDTPLGRWLKALLTGRVHRNVAVVALANKLARIS